MASCISIGPDTQLVSKYSTNDTLLSFHLLRADQGKILKFVLGNCFCNSANASQIWLYPLEYVYV